MTNDSAWVLGHRVRRWETDDSYALIEVTSPPKVPGPPPHYHKGVREFFLVLKGRLDVMADGVWTSYGPGQFVELPPDTVHTFVNNGAEDAVWVTGWRPKGFEQFFHEFGVPADRPDAFAQSVSEEVVARVVAACERYGMHVTA